MSRTPGLVCFGCVPLIQNERTNKYLRWAQAEGRFGEAAECCPSLTLTECPEDTGDGFTDPISDYACWYNPDFPESADFLGLWVVDLDGMENDPHSRGTSENGLDGSTFNRAIRPGRTLTFDVVMLAANCAGMEYGVDWVAKVLRGGFCSHNSLSASCGTDELKIRVCCPDGDAVDDGIRIFPSVATTQGIQRTDGDRRDKCCDVYRRYTFIITTERANKFGELQIACSEMEPERANVTCFDWDSCDNALATPDNCVDDPGCANTESDDFATATLLNTCYCDPLDRIRTCCCVPEDFAGQATHALIVDLYAGNSLDPLFRQYGARNIEINIYPNPKRFPCPETEEEYQAIATSQLPCARVLVGRIPAGSLLRLDGRTGEAFIVCRNKIQPVFDSIDGSIKDLVNQCYPVLVCAQWDAFNVVTPEDIPLDEDELPLPGYEPSSMVVYAARDFG